MKVSLLASLVSYVLNWSYFFLSKYLSIIPKFQKGLGIKYFLDRFYNIINLGFRNKEDLRLVY